MRPRHQVTRAAIELIKRFEGYRRKAAQLPDGRWTIGYGHTLTARQGAEVSESDAEALLLYDLIAVAHVVNESLYATLTQNQFDALCAFAFNIGLDNFRRSAVLKRINEGAPIQAAFAMELWRKASFEGERIVVDALVRRRAAEKLLFLTPPGEDWTPAPSPLLKPVLDLDGFDATPRQTPAPIAAPLDGEQALLTRLDAPESTAAATPAEEPETPTQAAAAEVTARLQSIYPETGESAEVPPEGDDQSAEVALPDSEPEPAPGALDVPPAPAAEDEPPLAPEEDFGASEPSPFARPAPANDLRDAEPEAANIFGPRPRFDDPPHAPLAPEAVHALPEAPSDGLVTLAGLAVLGLAFFGGGIFWAANARDTHVGVLTPLGVGLLAGLAGIGFFCVAIYLLLQRLSRAAERRSKSGRR